MRFLVYNASYEYLNIELIYLEILIMSSKKQLIIDFLLDNADPSIVLRVKKEVLNSLSEREERELLDRIIPQKNVQTVIQSQKPDGWFGNNLHGQSAKNGAGMFDNMEVGLRYLAEKGFPPENEYISKAVESFLTRASCEHSNSDNDRNTKNEDYKYTAIGLYLIRSSLIIRAGYEYRLPKNEFIDLKYDIDLSLDTFTEILIMTHRVMFWILLKENYVLNPVSAGLVYIICACLRSAEGGAVKKTFLYLRRV